jgi:hypothetical protein
MSEQINKFMNKGKIKMDQNENRQLVVVDPDTGEVIENVGASDSSIDSLDAIAKKSTGGLTGVSKTSFDLTTEKGRQEFDTLRVSNPPADHKQNDGWYGRTFTLRGFVCSAYLGKRDKNGNVLPQPEKRIRTAISDSEGRIMTSSSPYLYESLMHAIASHKQDGGDRPLRLKLVKQGPTDQVQRVYDEDSNKKKK